MKWALFNQIFFLSLWQTPRSSEGRDHVSLCSLSHSLARGRVPSIQKVGPSDYLWNAQITQLKVHFSGKPFLTIPNSKIKPLASDSLAHWLWSQEDIPILTSYIVVFLMFLTS